MRAIARRGRILKLELGNSTDRPLYRQIYDSIRQDILSGLLQPGSRLPSTRHLATDAAVARSTVVLAYEQLRAEGYLEGVPGAGTRVSRRLPDQPVAPPAEVATPVSPSRPARVSRRAQQLHEVWQRSHWALGKPPRAFRAGVPAVDVFPVDIWGRLLARRWSRTPPRALVYGEPHGYLPLRTAIADYLRAARGVRCVPEQILITSGSQQALDLTARVLLDQGDQAWMEDPGYHGARGALVGAGASIVPVPIDGEGLDVAAGRRLAPDARLAYVTPSRQLPLGVTMPLARRLELLRWANEANSWIIEDDYDSEFRFAARPIASLQGIDTTGCVLYAGTFSKVTFPALRLGYLVLPERVLEAFAATRLFMDYHTPYLEQAVMTDFIAEGHFERHIRRTRAVYQERQGALLRAAREHLPGVVQLEPADGGMTLIGWLDPAFAANLTRTARSPNGHHALGNGKAAALELPDARVARAAAERGVDVLPLSRFSTRPESMRPGLLFGYAGIRETEMTEGMRTLAGAIAALGG